MTAECMIAGDEPAAVAIDDRDLMYVVDTELRLLETNAGWDRFAHDNGGERAAAERPSVLDAFSGSARARWAGIYAKLLAGDIPGYSERFACPSPTMRRVYLLIIEPHHNEEGRVVQLVHRTKLLDQRPVRRRDRGPGKVSEAVRAAVPSSGNSLRLAGNQRPLEGAGGDLIWERRHEDGRRTVVLADVMGHGDLATRVADLIRAILAELPPDEGPGAAVRGLNDELVRRLPDVYDETMFATGLYLEIDPARARIRVSNFAHFGMLFSEKGAIDPPAGLPIGLFPADEPWPEIELSFGELGGRVMAYTDGIVEQFDQAGEMFGTAGLLREFLATLPFDLASSLDRIMASVDRFRGEALVKDDQSLLAIELAA